MKFFDYTADEREQWRKQDMTKAYLAELREQGDGCNREIVNSLRGPNGVHGAIFGAGILDGFGSALRIAGDDK